MIVSLVSSAIYFPRCHESNGGVTSHSNLVVVYSALCLLVGPPSIG